MFRKKEKPKSVDSTVERLKEAIAAERGKHRWTDAIEEPAPVIDVQALPRQHISASPGIQEQALAQIESLVNSRPHSAVETVYEPSNGGGVALAVRDLEERCQRLEETIEHVGLELRRLASQEVPQPFSEPHRSLAEPYAAVAEPPAPVLAQPFPVTPLPIGVVFADVPDFQGLMDMQRALGALTFADNASVVEFENGQASFELLLREPATAANIVDGLQRISGRRLLIEESRPDALKLRLRFAANGNDNPGLRPHLWAKA